VSARDARRLQTIARRLWPICVISNAAVGAFPKAR